MDGVEEENGRVEGGDAGEGEDGRREKGGGLSKDGELKRSFNRSEREQLLVFGTHLWRRESCRGYKRNKARLSLTRKSAFVEADEAKAVASRSSVDFTSSTFEPPSPSTTTHLSPPYDQTVSASSRTTL